ncbi:MAG TPA: sodium:proton antiporter, partial [Sulfitobacter sp.]|nr:sodium:proton antiporter [Sulfitobacter sp.]HBB84093.1 sodium:proton antiporter [Sulfitobacter sp.]
MSDGSFFTLDGYHFALGAVGAVVILAHWLPRFVSRREPAASGLLILLGMGIFALVPGMPIFPDPRIYPFPWEMVSELCVIVALFATGLRIDKLSDWSRWGPTARLLALTMPLTILSVALMGWAFAGMTAAGAILLG